MDRPSVGMVGLIFIVFFFPAEVTEVQKQKNKQTMLGGKNGEIQKSW